MSSAIVVRDMGKKYGDKHVLKGVNLKVERGEIFALLGVNGAGKTTALECIEGLRQYDSGSVELSGSVGIQLQSSSLPAYIRPLEAVELFARAKKCNPDRYILEKLDIYSLNKKYYYQLSTGQKRRLHLALAMSGDPDILFLDEPSAGLDIEGRAALHTLVKELNSFGKTIIMASHDMAEIESLCHRIAILMDGTIAFSGTIPEFNTAIGSQYDIVVKTDRGTDLLETDNVVDTLLTILAEYRDSGISVLDIHVDRGSLEKHFLALARRDEQ